MTELLVSLPALLAAHLQLTLVALTVSLVVSLPLGVLLARSPRLKGPALATAGVLQTIPSLALLALMVPVFVTVHNIGELVGLDTPVLGFLPAISALSLYGILPILRNTVTGLLGVDPTLTEAARGLGMTDRQLLLQVELPLAAPVIFAGIRTAAVWVVGTATLATPVGQTCLGDLIFAGLQTRSWDAVIVGCIGAAGLAVGLDLLLGWIERTRTGRRRAWIAGVTISLLTLMAASPLVTDLIKPKRPAVTVGAKGFTEQYILARVMQQRLENSGYDVHIRDGLGSSIVFDALGSGGVDAYVDYSGTIWSNHMDGAPAGRTEIIERLERWLPNQKSARLLGPLGFENTYAIAVKETDAETHGWTSLRDLSRDASALTFGADYEFFQRSEWTAMRDTYGIEFKAKRNFDASFLYDAAKAGDVDAITAYSTDGRITAFNLRTLTDPDHALPPYDAVLLVSETLASDPIAMTALKPLLQRIDVHTMREANRMVDQDGATPDEAARWLNAQVSRPQRSNLDDTLE